MTIFGVPSQALFAQLLVGVVNGAFYALLSLGLAVIFGMLHIVNFAHGVLYMLGAFLTWFMFTYFGMNYWLALLIAPLVVAALGMLTEVLILRRSYKLDPIYGLLLTFGIALVVEGLFREAYGVTGFPYSAPSSLQGGTNLGFMFLPNYRAWVVVASIVACLGIWYVVERTRLGSYLRAATENVTLVRAFGVNVPRMITLTYGLGAGLAALGGVMAAPITHVNVMMGSNIVIVVFAVVVIGGMGSIMGAVVSGFLLGVVEGLTKVFYPEASSLAIFVAMSIVLLFKPAGLFGKGE
ncbi:MAG: branched-chain amino acid ABC transporter permease [Burkholderiaceae bacterium]